MSNEGWAGGLEPGQRPAVLAIDLMRPYFEPGSPFDVGSRECLEAAARIIETARAAGVPVLHTRVTFSAGGADGGLFLRKVPALEALIVGVSTSGCVRASALDALQSGFIPLVIREGVGDRDRPAHDAALHDLRMKYAEIVSETDAVRYLQETGPVPS